MATAAGGGKKAAAGNNECVQVVVRCRPFSTKEKNENRGNIVEIDTSTGQIIIRNPDDTNTEPKAFTFDASFDETVTQRYFYEESCYPLVESCIEGYNSTIFAYGQTGCGKTHTMMGLAEPVEIRGVIPNSFDHIFETIRACTDGTQFLVRCSFLEIYQEEIRDLLAHDPKQKRDLKEDPSRGVVVKDLTDVVVQDEAGLLTVMEKGVAHRTVGATLMNEGSSRSHSIFTITIETSRQSEEGQEHFKVGKLNLVDLAGSERQSKTGATGDRLKEGSKINLSLSALGNVISALADGKGKHIPYRDSKLTRLLQDSLGGNTKTLMVAAISPADYNYNETLSTLRYANRAKNIKNKPKINEDPKDAILREYKEEIENLRQLLEAQQAQANGQPRSTLMGGAAQTQPRDVIEKETIVEVIKEVEREKIVEVESKELVEAKAALESLNASLIEDHNKLGQELQNERAAKEQLEKLLVSWQQQNKNRGEGEEGGPDEGGEGGVEEGGAMMAATIMAATIRPTLVTNDPEVLLAREQAEERRMRHKLKAKKRKELQLEAEKKKALEDKTLEIEAEVLRNVQEQSEATNKKLAKYKAKMEHKVREARVEAEDLAQEFERERDGYLETIRDLNREIKLWEQVGALILPQKSINKIWERAVWEDELEEWRLPRFDRKGVYSSSAAEAGRQQAVGKLPTIGAGSGMGGGGAAGTPSRRSSASTDGSGHDNDLDDDTYLAAEVGGQGHDLPMNMSRTPQCPIGGSSSSLEPQSPANIRGNSGASTSSSKRGGERKRSLSAGSNGSSSSGYYQQQQEEDASELIDSLSDDLYRVGGISSNLSSGGGEHAAANSSIIPIREWGRTGSSTSAAIREARYSENIISNGTGSSKQLQLQHGMLMNNGNSSSSSKQPQLQQGGERKQSLLPPAKIQGNGRGVLEPIIDPMEASRRVQMTTGSLLRSRLLDDLTVAAATGKDEGGAKGAKLKALDGVSAGKLGSGLVEGQMKLSPRGLLGGIGAFPIALPDLPPNRGVPLDNMEVYVLKRQQQQQQQQGAE